MGILILLKLLAGLTSCSWGDPAFYCKCSQRVAPSIGEVHGFGFFVYNQKGAWEQIILPKYCTSTFLVAAPPVLWGKNINPKDYPMSCCQIFFVYSQVLIKLNFAHLSLLLPFPILFAHQCACKSTQIISETPLPVLLPSLADHQQADIRLRNTRRRCNESWHGF